MPTWQWLIDIFVTEKKIALECYVSYADTEEKWPNCFELIIGKLQRTQKGRKIKKPYDMNQFRRKLIKTIT